MNDSKEKSGFGPILFDLERGHVARRESWAESQFIYVVAGSNFAVNRAPLNRIFPNGLEVSYLQHIDVHYDDGRIGVWDINQEDVFADDWQSYPPSELLIRSPLVFKDSMADSSDHAVEESEA